jgi:hypothetical protein
MVFGNESFYTTNSPLKVTAQNQSNHPLHHRDKPANPYDN